MSEDRWQIMVLFKSGESKHSDTFPDTDFEGTIELYMSWLLTKPEMSPDMIDYITIQRVPVVQ